MIVLKYIRYLNNFMTSKQNVTISALLQFDY